MNDKIISVTRRNLLQLIAGGGAGLALSALPGMSLAQGHKDVLVVGMDISDTITFDPARAAQFSSPLTIAAAYDTLVTMAPGNYTELQPALATAWARTPDGNGWRFTLRQGVKFASRNTMTAEDVKWSFDRVIGIKDQPSQYIANVQQVTIVDANTIDVILKDPAAPILNTLAAPSFVVYERKVMEEHGARTDAEDKATNWLNNQSAGTGAYILTAWARNAQIQLVRNPYHWRGMPGFQRIVIRHIPDGAAQSLAIQRGDIDVAFNLIPEQIAPLKSNAAVRIAKLPSLDFVYMALSQNPEFNKMLAIKEARQAVGYAIDYDGIRTGLLGGAAIRPATFLPIGVRGSTEGFAKANGFRQDLERAKKLLQKAGLPDGFEFELSYGNAVFAGVSYQILAQKIQADLARIGIKMRLNPMDQVNMRTQYTTSKSTAVMTYWNPTSVSNEQWAEAATQRVAKRVHWTPSDEMTSLVRRAAAETSVEKQTQMWGDFQKQLVDQANYFILFQPIYQIAVRNSVRTFPVTAAGWAADLHSAKA